MPFAVVCVYLKRNDRVQGKGERTSEEEAGRTSVEGSLLESFGSAVNTQKEQQKRAEMLRGLVLAREHCELAEQHLGGLRANSCLSLIGPELL